MCRIIDNFFKLFFYVFPFLCFYGRTKVNTDIPSRIGGHPGESDPKRSASRGGRPGKRRRGNSSEYKWRDCSSKYSSKRRRIACSDVLPLALVARSCLFTAGAKPRRTITINDTIEYKDIEERVLQGNEIEQTYGPRSDRTITAKTHDLERSCLAQLEAWRRAKVLEEEVAQDYAAGGLHFEKCAPGYFVAPAGGGMAHIFTRPMGHEVTDLYRCRPKETPFPAYQMTMNDARLVVQVSDQKHVILSALTDTDRLAQEVLMKCPYAKSTRPSAETKSHVSPVAASASHQFKRWLLDTGASQHMVPRHSVRQDDLYKATKPILIKTANGIVEVKKRAQVYIPTLGVRVEAIVLQSTPPALSIGRLVDLGFRVRLESHRRSAQAYVPHW